MPARISAKREGRERRARRRLQDDRVAGRQRRPELPRGHVQRVVPGCDGGDHADRIAPDDGGVTGCELVGRKAVHHPRRTGEEPEQVSADGHLVDGGADRLAGVGAFETAQLLAPPLEGVGDLEQHQRAILRRRLAPLGERLLRRVDRPVDVLGRARGHAGDDLVVGRVDHLGGPSVRGVDELPADELPIGLDALEDVGHGRPSWDVVQQAGRVSGHPTPSRKASRHAVTRRESRRPRTPPAWSHNTRRS